MKFLVKAVLFATLLLLIVWFNYLDIYYFGKTHLARDADAGSIPYVLVPGAGRNYPSSPNPNYAFLGRMDSAAALWQKHPHIKLILSGYDDGRWYHEPHDMLEALTLRGVPDSACLLDKSSADTFESLQFYKRQYGETPVIIVSQRLHLHRALWLASRFGITAWGHEAGDYPGGTPRWFYVREFGARVKARLEIWGWMKHKRETEY
ncbi:MAG: YdcF family protein [Bacteroidia bacterium]|nr:YdcF family protein [Bacteroidia bacterium]